MDQSISFEDKGNLIVSPVADRRSLLKWGQQLARELAMLKGRVDILDADTRRQFDVS